MVVPEEHTCAVRSGEYNKVIVWVRSAAGYVGRRGSWDGPLVVHAEGTQHSLPPAPCVSGSSATAAPSVFDMPPGSVVDTRLVVTHGRDARGADCGDRFDCGVLNAEQGETARLRFLAGAGDAEMLADNIPLNGGETGRVR